MENFDILNTDVLGEIFRFIPSDVKKPLNKKFYNQCPPKNPIRMDSFMRSIIRKDYALPFERYLKANYSRWRKITKWLYKNMKFYNYIEYIRYLCIECESNRCQNKLNMLEDKLKPNNKKIYKKIKIRHIRWNN